MHLHVNVFLFSKSWSFFHLRFNLQAALHCCSLSVGVCAVTLFHHWRVAAGDVVEAALTNYSLYTQGKGSNSVFLMAKRLTMVTMTVRLHQQQTGHYNVGRGGELQSRFPCITQLSPLFLSHPVKVPRVPPVAWQEDQSYRMLLTCRRPASRSSCSQRRAGQSNRCDLTPILTFISNLLLGFVWPCPFIGLFLK